MNGLTYEPPLEHVALYISPDAEVFRHPAVVVESSIAPDVPLIVRADVVVVDSPSTVVVERYKFPPALRNVHCARPPPALSASCGRVEEKEDN